MPVKRNVDMIEKDQQRSFDWVSMGLDKDLLSARLAIESYLSGANNESKLCDCKESLQAVRKSLQQVGIDSAVLLVEQLESLCDAIINSSYSNQEDAYQALLGGLSQLPSYLERTQKRHYEKPGALISVINNIRAVCLLPLLVDDVHFKPQLKKANTYKPSDCAAISSLIESGKSLLASIDQQSDNHQSQLVQLHTTVKSVRVAFDQADPSGFDINILDIVTVLLAGAVESSARASFCVKYTVARCLEWANCFLAKFEDNSQPTEIAGPSNSESEQLLRELLFCIAISDSELSSAVELRNNYQLFDALGGMRSTDLMHLGSPDAETMGIVYEGITQDITILTVALEKTDDTILDASAFKEMVTTAKTIKFTFQLINYSDQSEQLEIIVSQLEGLSETVDKPEYGQQDKETVQDIAQRLRLVEVSFQQQYLERGRNDSESKVLQEAKKIITRIIENLDARSRSDGGFDCESLSLDFDDLSAIPRQISEASGAMSILGLSELVSALDQCGEFVQRELVVEKNESSIRLSMNVLSAIEAYIEAAKYNQQEAVYEPLLSVLNNLKPPVITEKATEKAAEKVVEKVTTEKDSVATEVLETTDSILIENVSSVSTAETTELEQSTKIASLAPGASLDTEIDDDIAEIFLEEADEVMEALQAVVPEWSANAEVGEQFTEIRRAYHTLKGSGRMAAAEHLGDTAWAIEGLINSMADKSMPIDSQRIEIIAEAGEYMPHLIEAFSQRVVPHLPSMQSLIERAELLASDQTANVEIGLSLALLNNVEIASVNVADVDLVNAEISAQDSDENNVLAASIDVPSIPNLSEDEASIDPATADSDSFSTITNNNDDKQSINEDIQGDEVTSVTDDTSLEALAEEATVSIDNSIENKETEDSASDEIVTELFNDSAEDSSYLQTIFISELDVQLGVVAAYLESDLIDQSRCPSEAVERAFHTILGGAGIAENQPIAELAEPAEKLVHCIRQRGSASSQENQLLQATYDILLPAINGRVLDRDSAERVLAQLNEAVAAIIHSEKNIEGKMLPSDLLFNTREFLQEWRTGGSTPASFDSMLTALSLLEQSIDGGPHTSIKDVCCSLSKAYRCFSIGGLNYQAYLALSGIHSELEDMLDRAAAGQSIENSVSISVLDDMVSVEHLLQQQLISKSRVVEDDQHSGIANDIDEEIVSIFLEECEDLIEGVEAAVQSWLKTRKDMSYLESLLRPLHTIKGGARMAGLNGIGDISHEFETLLQSASNGDTKTNSSFFDKVSSFVADLIGAINDIGDQLATKDSCSSGVESAGDNGKIEDEKRPVEMVRVSPDLLEQLVNLAGETSISRSLIEEQVNDFSQSIDEIDSTVERLREQLRRLEIETEAQISFRREQVESKGHEEFDPLEMDRYSQVQQLSKSLVESASDLQDLKATLSEKNRNMETLLLQQARINTSLQEGLMQTRTVPLSRYIIPRLRRIVRQVSGELNKPVRFDVNNAGGELDRSMIDRMVAPLEHVLRNAIDHGIESSEDRERQGKVGQGAIRLNIHREGGDVVLELSDDGKGVDVDAVRKKAISLGLMQAGDSLSDEEIIRFIFAPGFSTAKSITQISGRGVGMDVVQSDIKELGGTVDLRSIPGQGATFVFRLPFTVSMNRVLLVSAGGETLAVPLDSIEGIVRVSPFELEEYYGENAAEFFYAGQQYDFQYLGNLVNGSVYQSNPDMLAALPILLVRGADQFVALQVDRLLGSREIVVKGLGKQFTNLEGIAGATVLGDGSVVMITDLIALTRSEACVVGSNANLTTETARACPLGMVIDDSVTVRKVTTRLLERKGFDVATAKDGLDAMTKLEDIKPDFILLDIEMPRMDGFEVLARIRNDERLADIPVIMITSRTGDKHRERALGLGANCFLGKPYQENILFETIEEVLSVVSDTTERFGT